MICSIPSKGLFVMERNLKLIIEYQGTRYHGWQIQPNGISIEEKIEEILERLTGQRPKVIGAGRTDAGVHAEGQTAHFKTLSSMDCKALQRGMNALLPNDIVVLNVEEAERDFHALFSAKGKTYRYVILNRAHPSVFERDRCWHISRRLDLDAMREGAMPLIGRHDFSAFQASGCCARNPVREIRGIEIHAKDGWISITVSANGFLKYMVRNIVGTLVEVGRGKMAPVDVQRILDSRDRTQAGPTAPAQGLFLVFVDYG